MGRVAEKRKFNRHDCRIRCIFVACGVEGSRFVTDLSASGLLLQKSSRPDTGAQIRLELVTGEDEPLQLLGTVVRWRRTHRSVLAMVPTGVGVHLDSVPEAYFQMVMDLEG